VLYLLSINVPQIIANANDKNKKAINRVENRKEYIFLSIITEFSFRKVVQK
jgi:hypothetical protein